MIIQTVTKQEGDVVTVWQDGEIKQFRVKPGADGSPLLEPYVPPAIEEVPDGGGG